MSAYPALLPQFSPSPYTHVEGLSGSIARLGAGSLATCVHLICSISLSWWYCLPPSRQTDTRIRPFGL